MYFKLLSIQLGKFIVTNVIKMQKNILFAFFISCFFAGKVFAQAIPQAPRPTEEEVERQQLFIEAYAAQSKADNTSAEKKYNALIEKDAKNAAAHYQLARLYKTTNKLEKSMQSIKAAIGLDEKNAWYKTFLAELLQTNGKYDEAAKIYQKLTDLEPNNQYYYTQWASNLGAAGEYAKAIKAFDALEKRVGINEEISRQKYTLYLLLKDDKKALREITRLCDAFPDNTQFLSILANFYEKRDDKPKALETYQKILKYNPSDANANLAVASLGVQQGGAVNKENAYLQSLIPVFEKSTVILDAKIKELIPYANKVADTKDKVLALECIKLVQILDRVHPEDAKVQSIWGDFLYHAGQPNEALQKYQKTLSLNKNVYSVWEQVMLIQQEQKDFSSLFKSSETAIDLFPNQSNAYYMHAVANSNKGIHNEAVTDLEQAVMMSGKNIRARLQALDLLGQEQALLNKLDAAKATYQKALASGGEAIASILEHYGDVLFQLNDTDNALMYWKKAKEKGAKSSNLDLKIENKKM